MILWVIIKSLMIAVYGYFIFLYFERLLGSKYNPMISAVSIIIYEIVFDYIVLCRVLDLNYFISIAVSQLGLTILVIFLFNGSIVKKLAFSSVMYSVKELTAFAVVPFLTILGDFISKYFFQREMPMLVNFLVCLRFFVSSLFLYEISKRCFNLRKSVSCKMSVILLIPSAFILLILEFTAYACNNVHIFALLGSFNNPHYTNIYELADVGFLFIMSVFGLAVNLIIVFETDHIVQQLLMKQQLNIQVKYYKELQKSQKELRNVKHDIKNHIISISKLLSMNKIDSAQKYLSEILNKSNFSKSKIKTGNYIADAILNEKYDKAKLNGIDFRCDISLPKLKISDFDICVIFGNALDNAIEACDRISSPDVYKFISVKSCIVKSYLILEFKNSTINKNVMTASLISKKENSDMHGIGLESMKAAADKYNGIMDISLKPNLFLLSLMLPL